MRLILLILSMILANQIQGNLGTVHAASIFGEVSFMSPPSTIDGVTLVAGRKYLLAAQSNPIENGIYFYTGSTFQYPTDENLTDGALAMLGSEVYVRAGAVHGGERFRLVNTNSTTIDGYENDVLIIGAHEQYYRRVGNRPGDIVTSFQTTYPGALLLDGVSTIGDTGSGASYVGPHLVDAFQVIRNIAPNDDLSFPGGDAAVLFDARGRVIAGRDNMGGTAANRLTSAASGFDGSALGAAGGAQTHTLVTDEIPAHSHTINNGSSIIRFVGSGGNLVVTGGSNSSTLVPPTIANAGGGGAHRNVQPTFVANFFLCL